MHPKLLKRLWFLSLRRCHRRGAETDAAKTFCTAVSTRTFGLPSAFVLSQTAVTDRVDGIESVHSLETVPDVRSVCLIFSISTPCRSSDQIPVRWNPGLAFCRLKYALYAFHGSLHIVKLSFLSSLFVYIVRQSRRRQNYSFRGLNTVMSKVRRTCDVCAGRTATTISFSWRKFNFLKETWQAYPFIIKSIFCSSLLKLLVSFTNPLGLLRYLASTPGSTTSGVNIWPAAQTTGISVIYSHVPRSLRSRVLARVSPLTIHLNVRESFPSKKNLTHPNLKCVSDRVF